MVCSAYSFLHVAKLYCMQVVNTATGRLGDDAMVSAISMTGV